MQSTSHQAMEYRKLGLLSYHKCEQIVQYNTRARVRTHTYILVYVHTDMMKTIYANIEKTGRRHAPPAARRSSRTFQNRSLSAGVGSHSNSIREPHRPTPQRLNTSFLSKSKI